MSKDERITSLEAELERTNYRLDKALDIMARGFHESAGMAEDILNISLKVSNQHDVLLGIIDGCERMDGDLAALTERVSDPLYRLGF